MNNQIKHFLCVFVVAGSLSFIAQPAIAELISFNFTGAITSVPSPPPYGLSVGVGDTVTGCIAYDPSLPPNYDTGSVAGYIQPLPSGMSVVIGGATIQSTGSASLQVIDNNYGVDNFTGYFTPISVNGVPQPSVHAISFYLADTSQTVFSSTALPDSLDAVSFNNRHGSVFAGTGTIFFSIDTISEGCEIPVEVDIKPNGYPNSINPGSNGKITVAILSTDETSNTITFDATTVDPTTVHFGATGTEAAPVQYDLDDVDHDNDIDIIFHFNTEDAGITCGDTTATIKGKTYDGQAITGTDSIRTINCN